MKQKIESEMAKKDVKTSILFMRYACFVFLIIFTVLYILV